MIKELSHEDNVLSIIREFWIDQVDMVQNNLRYGRYIINFEVRNGLMKYNYKVTE